ncbi:hypothetical protein PNEG_00703 [Pneumocystis murina B123]|uniref:C2H2-type domain-containing protein n=1 Tax=Pneumocystis murina (strain B123) TaxID=1069680 RepID=M7PB44_PNEMU|nr:hypothetical protein PNEG_00703 [Pneumocystis murina B123]EMR11105.1 hypothetical protein PNEG_00703 [Pneumocystis murina B123]
MKRGLTISIDNKVFLENQNEEPSDIYEASLASNKLKKLEFNESEETVVERAKPVITCHFPTECMHQPSSFMSFSAYEAHYQKQHCNVCFECRKVFPSLRMMDLHISEVHDPIFCLKKEKGERIFKCFIENCQELFINVKKRKKHLMREHFYPKAFSFLDNNQYEYHFDVIYTGISSKDTSLLVSKKNVKKRLKPENLEKMDQDFEIEKLVNKMTSTRLVPSSIRFGGGRNK